MRTKRKKNRGVNLSLAWRQKIVKIKENNSEHTESEDLIKRLEHENQTTKIEYNGNWSRIEVKFASSEEKEMCFFEDNGVSRLLNYIVRLLVHNIDVEIKVSYEPNGLGIGEKKFCRFTGPHSGPYVVKDNEKEYFCLIGEGTLSGAGHRTPEIIFSNFNPSIFIRDCSVEDSWKNLLIF